MNRSNRAAAGTISSPPSSAASRDSSLDAARGILMILGVFLHTSNIYSVHGGWLVSDTQTHPAFDAVGNLIHVFRMPAFFWISGYFCAMVCEKRGGLSMLRIRIPRLLVPLLTAWLLLNATQDAVMGWLAEGDWWAHLREGVPIYHLWFLFDLIIITLLFGASGPLLSRLLPASLLQNLWVLLAGLVGAAFALSAVIRATGIAYDTVLGVFSLYRILTYVPFFLAGVYMYHNGTVRQSFLRVPAATVLLTVPAAYYTSLYTHHPSSIVAESSLLGTLLFTWLAVAGVLRFFVSCFRSATPVTRFMSDSAYSIYLFHHPIVVFTGIALLPLAVSPWLKYAVICVVAVAVASMIHVFFVRRFRWAGLLFNGK